MSDLQDIITHNAHRAYEQGVIREQERIIKLLEEFANNLRDYNWQTGQMRYDQIQDAIALIKGEQK
jgi:predicted rRNA methylase YqxC with S4 and FtsJ domains